MLSHSGRNCEEMTFGFKIRQPVQNIRHINQTHKHKTKQAGIISPEVENYLIAALTCWLRITAVHNVVLTVEFVLPTAV